MLEATGQETGTFDHLFGPVTSETLSTTLEERPTEALNPGTLSILSSRWLPSRATNAGLMNVSNSAGLRPAETSATKIRRPSDLRRGQPDSRRRIHRLDHVIDELPWICGVISETAAAG